jgi:MFS family permease
MFKENKVAWRILGYLWVLGFVGAISRFVMAYYQQDITHTLEVNRTFISLTWSINIAIAAICSPLGGWLTDQYGPKRIMVLNSIFGVLSMVTVLIFPNPVGFIIGLGVLSGLSGIGATTGYVLITKWFTHHRAKALMIMTSANSLGLAVLTPIFVSNDDWLDWMTAFSFTLWIGIMSIPLTLLFIKDRSDGETSTDKSFPAKDRLKPKWNLSLYRAYVHNPTTIVVMIALFTCGFSMGTVEMHLMAIHQHAHVGQAVFTSSLSLLGLLELTGGLFFAFLLDRMSRTLALSCLYAMRVVAFIALFLHFEVSPILFSVIFGASFLGAIPGGMLVAGEALKEQQTSIGLQVGTLLVFHQVGTVLAALSGGVLYDITNSYQLLIGINILLSVVSAYGYYWVYAKDRVKYAVEQQFNSGHRN